MDVAAELATTNNVFVRVHARLEVRALVQQPGMECS